MRNLSSLFPKKFMKKFKKVLLYIWQLPQNLLALLLIIIYRFIFGKYETSIYKGINYVWYGNWLGGVSLGNYVLLGTWHSSRLDTVNHEYGHTRQSLYLGPLYLILIGLPSITWNIIDRILTRTVKSWTYSKSYKIYYYYMPWERWADILGNVERHFD